MRNLFTASIYARHQGCVLLVFHKRFNKWVPPGGKLEPNETPTEAAIRELREETGLTPTFVRTPYAPLSGTPTGLIGYEEHNGGRQDELHMNFVFVVDVSTRNVTPCAEHTDFRWFSGHEPELRTDAPEGVRRLVTIALSA